MIALTANSTVNYAETQPLSIQAWTAEQRAKGSDGTAAEGIVTKQRAKGSDEAAGKGQVTELRAKGSDEAAAEGQVTEQRLESK